MTNGFDITQEVIDLGKRQVSVEEKVTHIEEDVGEIKKDVKCLDGKFTKSYVNNKVTKLTVNAWIWFVRVSTVAIMGALVTKLFNLW